MSVGVGGGGRVHVHSENQQCHLVWVGWDSSAMRSQMVRPQLLQLSAGAGWGQGKGKDELPIDLQEGGVCCLA